MVNNRNKPRDDDSADAVKLDLDDAKQRLAKVESKVEKLSTVEGRVDKAYSSERYEEFQTAVEKIIHKELTTDEAHKKLNSHIDSRIEASLKKRWWKNWGLWTTLLATAAAVALAIRG